LQRNANLVGHSDLADMGWCPNLNSSRMNCGT
jgi:hypothetical protein